MATIETAVNSNEPKRVLLVDDEIDLCESLKDVLEDRGYTVNTCGSIQDGLSALEAHQHTVAIVDLRLGQESGLDFIGSGALGAPDTSFIMMTAYASTQTAVEALRRGAHDYIEKPVDIDRLINLIKRCFEQKTLHQEKLAAELALKAANEELEERVSQRTQELEFEIHSHLETEAELFVAKMKAERANAAKSAFLSSVSHELRTPMNAIMGFAQVLQLSARSKLNEREIENVRQIVENGDKLVELIDQVLDLSKLQSGEAEAAATNVSIDVLLEECADEYKEAADRKQVTVMTDAGICVGKSATLDRNLLKQALLNLISNAIKFNEQGGTVHIVCECSSDSLLKINVIDTGEGIAKQHHDAVFQSFQRIGREAQMIEGTGVGLSIAKGLVELMGGHITFESAEGEGSTFTIEIPMKPIVAS